MVDKQLTQLVTRVVLWLRLHSQLVDLHRTQQVRRWDEMVAERNERRARR